MYYYQQRISLREIKRLHEQNLIIDAKDGGLLLGPSHKEGGILFLFEYQDCFRVFGEVEGYEYIVNKEQVMKYQSIIHDINKYYTPLEKFEEYIPDSNITIIDAKHPIYKNRSKFIILEFCHLLCDKIYKRNNEVMLGVLYFKRKVYARH